MRGEREQKCLDWVKENVKNIFYYGFSRENMELFEHCLFAAAANPRNSEFPDFIFKDGIIEHFQITSSRLNRKGSVHQKEYSHYCKNSKNTFQAFQEEINQNPSFNKVQSKHCFFKQPEHSYEYLKVSFRKIWNSHLEGLKKYSGCKDTAIFLIDYSEFALGMYEDVFENLQMGLRYDDLRKPQEFSAYRLSRDKSMLDFLYKSKDFIKFVIYRYHDGCEAIQIDNIPELKKLLPWKFCIEACKVMNVGSIYVTNVLDK